MHGCGCPQGLLEGEACELGYPLNWALSMCVVGGEGTPAKPQAMGQILSFFNSCQNRSPLHGGHALLDVQAPVRDVAASGH